LQDDGDPHQFRFVGQLLDEPRMGDLHKLLVGALAQLHVLLPERVFADHERADALADQQIDDTTAGRVQIAVYAAITHHS
jgi:hypothetical protein